MTTDYESARDIPVRVPGEVHVCTKRNGKTLSLWNDAGSDAFVHLSWDDAKTLADVLRRPADRLPLALEDDGESPKRMIILTDAGLRLTFMCPIRCHAEGAHDCWDYRVCVAWLTYDSAMSLSEALREGCE